MKQAILLLLVLFLSGSTPMEQLVAGEQPNVLFVLADDWGWGDLSCHGHAYVQTPNLDRLASQGTEFYQFTVASGVCSPSRAAILTGHFPARHSIHGHFATVESHRQRGMPDWLNPKAILLPRLFQDSGYATAHFGKWHLTNIMVKDAPLPTEYGFDEYGAYNCSGPQLPVHADATAAIKFIEQSNDAGKPFFVNLWIHEPHTPHYPEPEYLQRFAHLDDEASKIYAAVLAHADGRIGEVLQTLDRLNIADNTLVIFTSDNGPENTGTRRRMDDQSTGPGFGNFASVGSTGGLRGRKRSLLNGGVCVPFIARWPGRIDAGKIDESTPISAIDLLPTLCSVANIQLPTDYQPDGTDYSPALFGNQLKTRVKPIFWDWKFATNRGDNWPAGAVRSKEWKLLAGKQGRMELFRVTQDRLEQQNLLEQHPIEAAAMVKLLTDWSATLPKQPDPSCYSQFAPE